MLISALLVAGLLTGVAQDAYTIKREFKEGQSLKYTITRTSQEQGGVMGLSMGGTWTVELKTKSVKDDATEIEMTKTPVRLDAEDNEMIPEQFLEQLMKPVTVTLKVDAKGAISTVGDRAMMPFGGGGQSHRDVLLIKLPGGPVKVGDTWKESVPQPTMPGMGESPDQVFTYKLDGVEKVDGTDAYKISITSVHDQSFQAQGGPGGGQGTKISFHRDMKYVLYIATTDGRVLKQTGTEETSMSAEGTQVPINQHSVVKLEVKPVK